MKVDDWKDKGNTHLDLELSDTMPYHEVVADLICKYAKDGDRLIDLGCGLGHVLAEVKSQRENLSFDIADAYPACLDATSKRGNVGQKFQLNELTFDVSTVIDSRYNIAVMSHVLEHLVFPAKALDDVFSILEPDGLIIVAVPNPVRPSVFLLNLFKRHYVNRGHVHSWDCSHWRNFLETIMGYEILETRSDYIQLPAATTSSLSRSIGKTMVKLAPWWGFSNIAVIKKKANSDSVFDQWKTQTQA